YHEFVIGMHRSHQTVPTIPAWLVCDREFIEKYGLGRVPPGRRRRRRFITSGYLGEAASLEAPSRKTGRDAAGLRETVRQHNRFAETGEDQEFGKGSTGPRLVLSVGSPLREVSVIFSEGAKRESKRARP